MCPAYLGTVSILMRWSKGSIGGGSGKLNHLDHTVKGNGLLVLQDEFPHT